MTYVFFGGGNLGTHPRDVANTVGFGCRTPVGDTRLQLQNRRSLHAGCVVE